MDEGWTRWLFDQNGIPYTRVVDADIRQGNLNQRFDVIILPDSLPNAIIHGHGEHEGRGTEGPEVPPEFRGGLGGQGLASLKAFAQDDGAVCEERCKPSTPSSRK